MAGINYYNNPFRLRLARQGGEVGSCVFISHRNTEDDKQRARELAVYIMKSGVNVYLDEGDHQLQHAVQTQDDKTIVDCIERGLDVSTHLLGIVSEDTKDSWWVPYEMGGARARRHVQANVIADDVKTLPSFVRTEKVVKDKAGLDEFISEIPGRRLLIEHKDSVEKSAAANRMRDWLPQVRTEPIRYY